MSAPDRGGTVPGETLYRLLLHLYPADFRARYESLKAGWPANRRNAYDNFVARANNASFGAQAAYDDLVPAFQAVFDREGGNWPRFYAEVRRIAALSKDERHRVLRGIAPPSHTARQGATPTTNGTPDA